jgi:hypothetical protein
MSSIVLESYWMLARLEIYLANGSFQKLYERVRRYPVSPNLRTRCSVEELCAAIDMACIWYCKQVLCLQRSAATVCLLKRHGISAAMVIGAQTLPFKAHAWVEVDGRVVNDKTYVQEMYQVLDRC